MHAKVHINQLDARSIKVKVKINILTARCPQSPQDNVTSLHRKRPQRKTTSIEDDLRQDLI